MPTNPPPTPRAPATVRLACDAMATRFELVLFGGSEHTEPRLRAAGEEALAEIQLWHQRLSWFDPSSFLSHLNRHAADRPVKCDPEVFELLALCKSLARQTRHHFNPAIGAMMVAAGFRSAPRDESALTAARAVSHMKFVTLDPSTQTITFTRPGLSLDLGAIAKGWALDKALTILRTAKIPRGIMHGGTSSIIAWDDASPPLPEKRKNQPKTSTSRANPSTSNVSALAGTSSPPPGHQIQLGPTPNAPIITLHNAALGISAQHGRMINGRGHVLSTSPPTSPATSAPELANERATDLAPNPTPHSAAVLVPLHSRFPAATADAWSTALLAALTSNSPPPRPPTSIGMLRIL